MKPITLFLILILIAPLGIYARRNDSIYLAKKRYPTKGWNSFEQQLIISSGGYFLTLDHPQTSPLVKTGSGATGNLAYLLKAPKFYASTNVELSGASTGGELIDESEMLDYNLMLRVKFNGGVKLKRPIKGFDIYLGGSFSVNEHIYSFSKSFNAGFQYLNSYLFGGNLYAERPISFRFRNPQAYTPFKFSYNLSVPLIGVVSTPPYNGFYDFTIPERQISDDMIIEAKPLGEILVIDSKLNFDWYMRNSNALRLSYNWVFGHYNVHSGTINMASHAIELALLMKLDRNSSTTRLHTYGY